MNKNINRAIENSKYNQEVKLIAVTKNFGVEEIELAIENGITDIGENRVQELVEKYKILGDKVNYHMIGHLQTNKVKYIIDKVKLIHSLDRLSLAKEINKRAEKYDIIMDTLIQINISKEETKQGISVEEVDEFINSLSEFKNIRVKGLMTIAPYENNIEDTRWIFKELKAIYQDIKSKNYKNVDMEILSMGMTNDYEIAIEEGSTMVRVGTGIFGKRKY